MSEVIHEHSAAIITPEGERFLARTHGEERADGTWIGWLEFIPAGGREPILRTDRETTQPNRNAVAYWAEGLEPIYLEGALERALAFSSAVPGQTAGAARLA